jgi:hypothetical protein
VASELAFILNSTRLLPALSRHKAADPKILPKLDRADTVLS